jgi:hypothetical protein
MPVAKDGMLARSAATPQRDTRINWCVKMKETPKQAPRNIATKRAPVAQPPWSGTRDASHTTFFAHTRPKMSRVPRYNYKYVHWLRYLRYSTIDLDWFHRTSLESPQRNDAHRNCNKNTNHAGCGRLTEVVT